MGHALRCHHLGWGAAPFLSCTQAVSSEATQQPAMPLSHNLWTLVLPDQARRPSSQAQIQTPHLGGPSGVCRQPPGCCWVCSRAGSAPIPTQTSAFLVPTLSPAGLRSNVTAEVKAAVFTTKAKTQLNLAPTSQFNMLVLHGPQLQCGILRSILKLLSCAKSKKHFPPPSNL